MHLDKKPCFSDHALFPFRIAVSTMHSCKWLWIAIISSVACDAQLIGDQRLHTLRQEQEKWGQLEENIWNQLVEATGNGDGVVGARSKPSLPKSTIYAIFKLVFENGLSPFASSVPTAYDPALENTQCHKDSLRYVKGLQNWETWALKSKLIIVKV